MSNTVQPAVENNVFYKALITFSVHVFSLFVLAYFSWREGAWQIQLLTLLMGIGVVVSAVGLWQVKKGNQVLGAWLIIGVSLYIAVAAGLLISNIGLILAAITMLSVSLTAGQLLPQKYVGWAVVAIFTTSVFVVLLDQIYLPYRWPALDQNTFIVIVIVSITVVGYGYFLRREFKDYSLRTKFIFTVLMVTLIPLGILTFLDNRLTQIRLTDSANQNLLVLASQTTNSLDTFLQGNLDAIENEAKLPLFLDRFASNAASKVRIAEQRIVLGNLARKDPLHIISYGVLDRDGTNLADSLGQNIGKSEAGQDYLLQPLETGQPYMSPVLFDPKSGEPVIYFSAPVRNVLGTEQGVLRAKYKATLLQEFLESATEDAAKGSFAVLFDENLLHLAHSNPILAEETNYKLVDLPQDPNKVEALQSTNRLPLKPVDELSTGLPELYKNLTTLNLDEPFFEALEITPGGERVENQVAVSFLEIQPWPVAFFQSQDILFEPIQTQTRTTVLIALGISVLVAVIAVIASRQLTRPIINLTSVAQEVAQGNLRIQAPVESKDEIGQLSIAFNSMTTRLRELFGSLEDQVQERTSELALSIEVGQRAVAIRDLETLLPTITEFIKERFDLYYVHVYFLDDLGRDLIIKYGTGAVGQTLMERQHSLPTGAGSIVGQVASSRQFIVVSDTETSDIHKPNPLLPDTRSEMAVPLIVEEKVIGVLDMQSDRVDTFRQDNATVFEALATQLALSIDSAQQWELSQEAQRKSEETLKQVTREQWATRLSARREALGFAYNLSTISRLQPTDFDDGVSAPVVVQNQNIGQLAVSLPKNRKLTDDENALLNAVAQQLGQKAENLRLFEETQQQATREQLARQIADKIRASRDIETALNTAAKELSQALGLTKAQVNLDISSLDTEENS